MKEVFEALERLKTAPSFMGGTQKYMFYTNSSELLLEDYDIVYQALTELKAIKEAKPSEALECLERIGNEEAPAYYYYEIKLNLTIKKLYGEEYKIIKQALLKAQR